jgi:phosphoglycolate phosphatase
LFDIDGTLLRGAGPHHKEALIDAAISVMGVECTLEGVDTAGCMDQDLVRAMLTNAGVGKRRIISSMTLILEAAQHHYSVHCKSDFSDKLCPGVAHVIGLLAKHDVPMGLVTGNLSAIAWRKLENAGIDRHFSFGAFAEQAKTRARVAKLALWDARKKELAAQRCSVTLIGDHANDIAAAKANGFRSVAVATGVMPVDELLSFQPDVVLRSLESASMELIFGNRV